MRSLCSCEHHTRTGTAHEHYRARPSAPAIVSRTEQADGVGLAALSQVWRPPHMLLGWVQSPPLVFGRATGGTSAAAQVPRVCWDLFGAVGAAGGAQGRGSWYGREVQRCAVDQWQHGGSSMRRTAEFLRSWMGRQERWLLWRPLAEEGSEHCYLSASTVHRWLDRAGKQAQASVDGQLTGIGEGKLLGTDGLWAKLKGKAQRVVLLVVDSVSGLIYPPLVAKGEESEGPWQRLFARAQQAGLDPSGLSPSRAKPEGGARGDQRWRPRSAGLPAAASGLGSAPTLRVAPVAQPGRRTVPSRHPGRSRPHRCSC